ncbi:hypothetical protein [uncultured Vibrio sp.]|uniref:hypothetical protein n=1 Tax=uncultured Vibrio sp. TaxID=114054 RepID=UPI002603B155|nr:hypothetical protein [uncultured Vibrio sp.]
MTMIQLGLTELAVGLVMFFGIYGDLGMGIKAEFEAKKRPLKTVFLVKQITISKVSNYSVAEGL